MYFYFYGSSNGLLPGVTKSLPDLMLTCENLLGLNSYLVNNIKSTLVTAMACFMAAPSHYLDNMMPYNTTGVQTN